MHCVRYFFIQFVCVRGGHLTALVISCDFALQISFYDSFDFKVKKVVSVKKRKFIARNHRGTVSVRTTNFLFFFFGVTQNIGLSSI
jgi:hypothetical protein